MKDSDDDREPRLLEREPEPLATPAAEIDAAESRWDPWLMALARAELAEAAPRAN